MFWRAALALGLVAALAACSGGGGNPRTPATTTLPATTTSTIDPSVGLGLAHTFNHMLGTANGALYALGDRLKQGGDTSGTALPADFVATATTLATAELTVVTELESQTWPAPVDAEMSSVVSALQTFAADLQLLSSLSPSVFADWQRQFNTDGGNL